jgi:hypothetical protein
VFPGAMSAPAPLTCLSERPETLVNVISIVNVLDSVPALSHSVHSRA